MKKDNFHNSGQKDSELFYGLPADRVTTGTGPLFVPA